MHCAVKRKSISCDFLPFLATQMKIAVKISINIKVLFQKKNQRFLTCLPQRIVHTFKIVFPGKIAVLWKSPMPPHISKLDFLKRATR